MGSYWLHKSVQPLTTALGSKFKLYSGYASRCRSSGGFNDIRGIIMHHDADNTTGEDDWVLRYEYETAQDGPIGNLHVQRDGDVWFGAAGASNHAGKGGPVSTSRGTIPLNTGNLYLIGIEASNNGMGEVWPQVQMESYLILVTVLCQTFELDPLTDIYGHWTWCEPSCAGRKIDPRGPTPSYPKIGGSSGTNKWNMQEVRKEVKARMSTSPQPQPPIQEDDMKALIIQANGGNTSGAVAVTDLELTRKRFINGADKDALMATGNYSFVSLLGNVFDTIPGDISIDVVGDGLGNT